MIGEPPSELGAEKLTVACPFPAVAAAFPGAPGGEAGAAGVTAFDGADGGPEPAAFAAVTVKVYAVPFVSPPTTIGLALAVAVFPPGDAMTV